MSKRYDTIIVGARPAGAGMAAFLSQAGFSILLVDRVHFPKPTLSSPIYFGSTLSILNRLGALPVVQALGAPPLHIHESYITPPNGAIIHVLGHIQPYDGFDYMLQIPRERFDAAFFEYVAQLPNVETRLGFNITGLEWDQAHTRVLGIRGRSSGGAAETIHASIIVGADGYYSTVAQHVNAAHYNEIPPRTCVYYAYYSNAKPSGAEPTATIYYNIGESYSAITANSVNDLTVFSLSLPASRFDGARADHETIHTRHAAKIPALADRLRGAKRETPLYGVTPRGSFYRQPYGAGWVLIGDAGYYKDPLTGQGIYDALRSAELASNALISARANGGTPEAEQSALRRYQKTRDQETRASYRLADFYADLDRPRSSAVIDLMRAVAALPQWSDRFVNLFTGVTDIESFMRPTTAVRIWSEWRARQLFQKFSGKPLNPDTPLRST